MKKQDLGLLDRIIYEKVYEKICTVKKFGMKIFYFIIFNSAQFLKLRHCLFDKYKHIRKKSSI